MPIIKPQTVIVSINSSNKQHLIKQGYDLTNKKRWDKIEVDVEILMPTSMVLVKCICDYCDAECIKTYYYVRKSDNKICCSVKCGIKKISEKCFKEHGVTHHMHRKEVRDKQEQTMLQNYGVKNAFQAESSKEKIKKTNIENLGVEYPMQSQIVRDKSKESCIKNLGVNHPSKSTVIKQQKEDTTFQHFGVKNPFQAKEIQEQIKQQCLEEHGVENHMRRQEIKDKIKATTFKNHGVENTFFNNNKNIKATINQIYICNLFRGELNKNIGFYFCDIVLEEQKIIVEYDGAGHWLRTILGEGMSLEQFNIDEVKREKNY